jgi:FlaA1/EpsC-like NDP-sugar epimerase
MNIAYSKENDLASVITGRSNSFFEQDLLDSFDQIDSVYRGKIVAVCGAAGSIGKSTLSQLLKYSPAEVLLVDVNENQLVELVREIRLNRSISSKIKLTPIVMDISSPIIQRLPLQISKIDSILNFAAIKHVRSERDVISTLRMLEVNIVGTRHLLAICQSLAESARLFSVSTDKAANPVNMMGVSKRVMEAMMFNQKDVFCTSARFANVAFSNGSLLDSWLKRIANHEPIAVPANTKRYFVSPEESGHLCLIASSSAQSGEIAIPNMDPANYLVELTDALERLLKFLKITPVFVEDEEEAVHLAASDQITENQRVVLRTTLNTEGEKPHEEFVGQGDIELNQKTDNIRIVRPETIDGNLIHELENYVFELINGPDLPCTKMDIVNKFRSVVPGFQYVESDEKLDNRI